MCEPTFVSAALAAGTGLLLSFCAGVIPAKDSPGREWDAPARAAGIKNPIPADDQSIAAGKIVYTKECSACHGESGRGNGPEAANLSRQPADLCAAPVQQQRDGEIFWKITEGKKPMPSYAHTLKDEERWQVVNYIRSLAPGNAR